MGILYLDATEFIRHREFAVNVPAFYHPNMPDHLTDTEVKPREKVNPFRRVAVGRLDRTPFRQVIDPDQKQYAKYSIQVMIDMFLKKLSFEILNDDDIPEILDGIDRYLLALKDDVILKDEKIIAYARKVVAFRVEVYKFYFRYMNLNPVALENIYPNHDQKKNIFSLMAIGVRQERLNMDPLRARALPPYDIDKLSKTNDPDKPGDKGDFMDETSLGLGAHLMKPDDEGDFDFQGFLSGK